MLSARLCVVAESIGDPVHHLYEVGGEVVPVVVALCDFVPVTTKLGPQLRFGPQL